MSLLTPIFIILSAWLIIIIAHYYKVYTFNIETDECAASPSPCQHVCTNTVGSFQCSCNNGYLIDSDETSCNGMFAHML